MPTGKPTTNPAITPGEFPCLDCGFVARHRLGLGRHRSARHATGPKRAPAKRTHAKRARSVSVMAPGGDLVAGALKDLLRVAAAMDAIIRTQQADIERLTDDVATHERNIAELLKRMETTSAAVESRQTLEGVLDDAEQALLERLMKDMPKRAVTDPGLS